MKASRRKVLEAPMNVDLPVDLVEAIDAFCDTHRCKKKLCVELALRQFLQTHQAVKK